MSLAAYASQHSPQHQSLLTQHHQGNHVAGGSADIQDWLKAWKSWAGTRKRGKMAQFIVQKLEECKQARWLDITIGKFELTEWHSIAEEWFKEKPRSSDQVDAPCMLRKGLPRAFPGLEEVKTESIKEGTQYRSRVFQATPLLVQEVRLYVNKSFGVGYPNGTVGPFYNPQPSQQEDGIGYSQGSSFITLNSVSSIVSSQQAPHYSPSSSLYSTNSYSNHLLTSAPHKLKGQSFNPSPISMPSPGTTGGHVKLEETSPYSVHNSSPYSGTGYIDVDNIDGSPAASDTASTTASPYTFSGQTDGGSMFNGGGSNLSPAGVRNDSQGFDGYDHISDSSPYSVNGGGMSPAAGHYSYGPMLQVPTSGESLMGNEWFEGAGSGSHMQNSGSPQYSPESSFQQQSSNPTVCMSQPHSVSPTVMAPSHMHQLIHQHNQPALLEVKPYPDRSPLEGGGHLALVFGGQLPRGPKWLSFISQQRPEYVHQVEALEENIMALSTIIPKHDIPETMTLQVICSGQVVAQSDFTYYANAQYNSDLLFQYLVQNFPGYFPEMAGGFDGGMGPDGSGGGGIEGYSSGYYTNIPSTSYNLLLGSCRLGIEELVHATLDLPSMAAITTEQLRKAQLLCEEHSHSNLAEVMKILVELSEHTLQSRGDEESEVSVLKSMEGQNALSKLDVSLTPEDGGTKIISRLLQIHKMNQRSKLEEEREQQVPSSPTIQPASPVPQSEKTSNTPSEGDVITTAVSPQQRRSSRLPRQEQSVREDDDDSDLAPPTEIHSRTSIIERDDHVPELRPVLPTRRPFSRKAPLYTSYSDAADSAVSMSFDREVDFELEVARRSSASLASSGLYSLNKASMDGSAFEISIDPEVGYTFANSLQYECVYQVTDDYPPQSDATSVIFKSGDRIIQVGDTPVRDKGPDDFAELLQNEAVKGTSVRIIPRVSPPPSFSSISYGSMDSTSGRSLIRKQSDHQLDSITLKVSNLLSMKGSGFRYKRSVTLPFIASEKGFGFSFIGGNVVGLFVSEVKVGRKELQVGDQILEIAGHNAVQMSHYEASDIISHVKDKLFLKVTQNPAKFKSIRDQFEYESFYIRCHVDHTPSDPKDMTLTKGTLVRVVNSVFSPNSWLAWSVDENTGIDVELKRIPSPARAYQQFGKEVYQSTDGPQIMVS